jgi:DNA-directed RNA polymerase specialized sigma24 family protein
VRITQMSYHRLRSLGHRYLLHGKPIPTLQSKDLVHELLARLAKETIQHNDVLRFYAVFSRHLRLMLVEGAHQRYLQKALGYQARSEVRHLAQGMWRLLDNDVVLLRLHEALKDLERHDPDIAHACQLYYFGGHTLAEMATLMGATEGAIGRQMRFAKAWLLARLQAVLK